MASAGHLQKLDNVAEIIPPLRSTLQGSPPLLRLHAAASAISQPAWRPSPSGPLLAHLHANLPESSNCICMFFHLIGPARHLEQVQLQQETARSARSRRAGAGIHLKAAASRWSARIIQQAHPHPPVRGEDLPCRHPGLAGTGHGGPLRSYKSTAPSRSSGLGPLNATAGHEAVYACPEPSQGP